MKIKLLTKNAKMPTRGSAEAAGWDLYSANETVIKIKPHSVYKIPTGIAGEIPSGCYGGIYPRSGLATKDGLRLANCVGVIDSDYRGEWIVPIYNDSDTEKEILPNTKIAQVIISSFVQVELKEVKELNETERGGNGFGSTGVV